MKHSITVAACIFLAACSTSTTTIKTVPADATSAALPSVPPAAQPMACYLPTESNVPYGSVTALQTGKPDAIIVYGESEFQFAELWLPLQDSTKHEGTASAETQEKPLAPLVIFIHGGCWLNQFDIKHTHALSTGLAQAGYAVYSIEYRRTGDEGGGWPGSYNDIKAALVASKTLSKYPIDMGRVALAGHSAGGHLALLAGSEPDVTVSTVIGLAAIVDIADYSLGSNSCQTATPAFMDGTLAERPAEYTAANPIHRQWHPNTHLIHGTADTIVPLTQSANYSKQRTLVEGAGHFDMVHPGTPAFKTLLKTLASELK